MKYSQFLASAALVAVASTHATIWNMYVNDVNQGVGNSAGGYIRFPPNNSPVKDITSKDMTCNVNNVAAAKTVTVTAGDKITLEWHHDTNSASDDIIDGSHKGPVMVYIAPTSSNGAGDVWVKLAEDGYSGGKWAVDTLIANKGKHSFTLPSVLADGDYLIRGEIIALHESDAAFNVNPVRGAQFYMECLQVKVTGGGSTKLPAGVAIPGAYSYSDPGVVFNLYGSYTSYKIPGPAVWNAASGGTTPPKTSTAASVSNPATSAAAPVTTSSKFSSPASSSRPVATPKTTTKIAATSAPAASSAPAPTKPASSTNAACPGPIKTTLITVVSPRPTTGVKTVAKYGQCGGSGYAGSITCAPGSTCKVQNPYYSQCV